MKMLKRLFSIILAISIVAGMIPKIAISVAADEITDFAPEILFKDPISVEVDFETAKPEEFKSEETKPEESKPEETESEPEETVTVYEKEPYGSVVLNNSEYTYTVDSSTQTVTITQYNGSASKLTVPATLDGYPVTAIGNSAFSGCTSLTEIKLPDGITTIGYNAFTNCESLTSINYPLSLTKVVTGTFNHGDIFRGCKNLKSITVPEGVTVIPANTFYGCNYLEQIILPSTLITIGNSVFDGCTSLLKVNLPESVVSIGRNAFNNCPNLLIYCYDKSDAMIYAIENNIPFVSNGGFIDSDEYALGYNDCYYYADINSVSANGYITMTVDYEIKDIWKDKIKDKSLYIVIPDNVILDEFTLKLNGSLCGDYSFNNDRYLEVPVTENSGTLKFSVKISEQRRIFSYASMLMSKDGEQVKEIIGIVNEEINALTLHAAERVSDCNVEVSGFSPASAEILLYVDGVYQKKVAASKAGNWSSAITLDSPENYRNYKITARCITNDVSLEQSAFVTYSAEEAKITDFVMYYNEHNVIKTCDLLNSGNTKPKVYFVPGTQFDFEIAFDHPEQINTIYVTSTRNQEIKYLEAKYDETKGVFVTDGFFDENNSNYVPGVLSIEYTKKVDPVYVSNEYDWSKFDENLPENIEDVVTVVESTKTDYTAEVDLGSVYSDLRDVMIEASFSVYDEATDGNLSDWLGAFKDLDTIASYIVPGYDDEKYIVSLDLSDRYNQAMLVHDITGNNYMKLSLDLAIESTENLNTAWTLTKVSSTLSTVNTASGLIMNQLEIERDMDELREEVMRTQYGSEEKLETALNMVDELENNRSYFSLITTVIPLVVGAVAITGGAAMTVAPIMFTALLGVFTSVAPMFWDMRVAHIKSGQFKVDYVVDPSGYVYNIYTNERIEGVKTTAYYVPYDESENFWINPPADSEYGEVWDASEYDQNNPLYTNADGKYAWDVPEGWWRVKYEKEGFETTWSEWLPVPPPQTEVNIGMIPLDGAHEHVFEQYESDDNATCEDDGTATSKCKYCNVTNTIKDDNSARGHNYGDWIVTSESNCTIDGTETRTCSNCEAFETQIIPATGEHIFGEWVVTVEPTALANGEKSRKCENCDATETEEIAKLEMTNPFTDVKDGQWYTEGILWCYHSGYMAGVSDTEFGRKSNVTRAMFATILAKIDGSDISGYSNMSFTDVKPGQWYSNAIEWAASNGYAAGLGEGIFGYKQNVSREQIALFFYTYSSKNNIDVTAEADLSGYADLNRVHSWALDAVEWAVAKGLISGTSATTLSPRDSATRAEIALIVKNFVETVKG